MGIGPRALGTGRAAVTSACLLQRLQPQRPRSAAAVGRGGGRCCRRAMAWRGGKVAMPGRETTDGKGCCWRLLHVVCVVVC